MSALLAFSPYSAPTSAAEGQPFCGTKQWQSFIAEAADRFNLPQPWLHGVIRVESAGCIITGSRPTTSSAGAVGLMQLMPDVWVQFRDALHLGAQAYDPHDNIVAGAAYLRELYDRYGVPGCFAAYHAGPARYERYLVEGQPLPAQTLEYLEKLQRMASMPGYRAIHLTAKKYEPTTATSSDRMVVTHHDAQQDTERALDRPAHDMIFVVLKHREKARKSVPAESLDVQHE